MTSRAYLLAGFLFILLAMSGWSYAETIPATSTQVEKVTTYYWDPNPCSSKPRSPDFQTKTALYTWWVSGWPRTMVCDPNHNPATLTLVSSSWNDSSITASATWYPSWDPNRRDSGSESAKSYQACPSGAVESGSSCVQYSCPAGAGWTLSGNSCSRTDCLSGEVRDQNGQCRSACKSGTKLESGWYQDTNGDGKINSGCFSGCKGDFKGTGPTYVYWGQYQSTPGYVGDFLANGETCSTASQPDSSVTPPTQPATDTPEYKCASQGMSWGDINGQVVCVPAGTSGSQPYQNPPATKTDTNPDGTTEKTITQDQQDGETVTRVTTKTTYDSNGNPVTTTTTSSTAPMSQFCETNPDAAICKQSKTNGGGDCATPPQSSGDAIQAAILRQTWETRCQVQKQNDAVDAAKQWADGVLSENVISPLSGSQKQTVNFGMFDTTNILGAASCPAPIAFAFLGFTFQLGFDSFCWIAEILGHLIVIAASIVSMRMVLGGL